MEVSEKRSIRPVISGLIAAILGIVLFYAGSMRFGTFAHIQAYGGWRCLFSITPRQLGYHGSSHLFLDADLSLIVASVAGMSAISRAASSAGVERFTELPALVAMAMFVVATPVFHRIQAITLNSLSKPVLAPFELVEEAGLHRALVLMANRNAPRPLSWVYYQPLPKPDFSDDVLHVRDSNAQADAALALRYPDRTVYRMRRDWEGRWQLAPLGAPASADDAMKLNRSHLSPEPASVALTPAAE